MYSPPPSMVFISLNIKQLHGGQLGHIILYCIRPSIGELKFLTRAVDETQVLQACNLRQIVDDAQKRCLEDELLKLEDTRPDMRQ